MCLQVLDKWYVLCTTLLTRLKQCHHPFISDLTLCDSALPNVYIHSLLCKGHLVWRYCHKVWTLCDVCHAWPFFSQLWDNLRGRPAIAKRRGGLYRLGLGLGNFAMADQFACKLSGLCTSILASKLVHDSYRKSLKECKMTVKHVWFLQKLINSNTGITSYGALGHVAWSLYIYTNLAISIYI